MCRTFLALLLFFAGIGRLAVAQVDLFEDDLFENDPFDDGDHHHGTRILQLSAGGRRVIRAGGDGEGNSGQQPQDPAALKKQRELQRKAEHLEKISELPLDRSAASILSVWASPPPKPFIGPPEPVGPGELPRDTLDETLAVFQRDLVLGHWTAVKQTLAELPQVEGEALYARMLEVLQQGAPPDWSSAPAQVQAIMMQQLQMLNQRGVRPEVHMQLDLEDLVAVADAAPGKLDEEAISALGTMFRTANSRGMIWETCISRLHQELKRPTGEAAFTSREVAKILMAAGQSKLAGEFLPGADEAIGDNDFEALNLLSTHFEALFTEKQKPDLLEQAWRVTQAVLAADEGNETSRDEALRRAVHLAPRVRAELGQQWFTDSFAAAPQRGKRMLASIGASASRGLSEYRGDAEHRLEQMKLQSTAVEALLARAPRRAAEWRDMLDLLAQNWLAEAAATHQHAKQSDSGPQMTRDMYGNMYYSSGDEEDPFTMLQRRGRGQIEPIAPRELLAIRPSAAWLESVDAAMLPQFDVRLAQLYLKDGDEDASLPYVEKLAAAQPRLAQQLVEEFLDVWTANHDPNSNQRRTNQYMFMFGFEQRAESIPLTRSKQERNLRDLAQLVARFRKLPLEELDEQRLARAFLACHSEAEVYKLATIERVFGPLEEIEPQTVAQLAQQMRANLAGLWRAPAVQERNKTNRKQKDIEAEVFRGYQVAHTVLERGREKHADDWSLQLAGAALAHDESNFKQDLARDSKTSERRLTALVDFEKAAALYAAKVPQLEEDAETADPFEQWYYASLGASDLGQVREDHVADLSQPAKIRDAIAALPGEAAQRHFGLFANGLFNRLSAVKPAVKFRYLRGGFEIVGDAEQAIEARKVFDYYKDLVTEIQLRARIDGSDVVGHKQPFGVFVEIRHTREIERESGGFGRYLQNQNSGSYYYNYGRPNENYREKFEDIVKQALDEHFEILSVTFQSEDVHSKAEAEYGWRVTPYAYLLLKARGPEVDKLPPVRLDLDFLDTSGYAVLPIESPAVPLDAQPVQAEPRPIGKLAITQTLDERQADAGKLILEIKATGQGLIPEFDDLLELAPDDFDVVEIEDQGVAVDRFDPDSDDTVITSQRNWLVNLAAKPGLPERPKSLRFGDPKLETTEVAYQRYVDADLVNAEQTISLEQAYGRKSYAWLGYLMLGLLVVGGIAIVLMLRRPAAPSAAEARFQMPQRVTPFTIWGLLRQIELNNGLGDAGRDELSQSIERLEKYYFVNGAAAAPARHDQESPDLVALAETWIRRAR